MPSPYWSQKAVPSAGEICGYTVTTDRMPLQNGKGEIRAHLFFTAYTSASSDQAADSGTVRPLLFAFSGGPGLASTLLHLGAIGPKRVRFTPEGQIVGPPYEIVENPHTLLDQADLVFLDPIGTGFSEVTQPNTRREYWGIQQDIEAIGEFIRAYLAQYDRWFSPLYLLGTSYGTARAAGLADHLLGLGIGLSGLVLVSPGLDWLTGDPRRGHDLPYVLALTAAINYYLRTELGIVSSKEYCLFNKEANDVWDWGAGGQGYPERAEALRNAMTKNPRMKVFIASGYFDLTTPYRETQHTLTHLGLDVSLRASIRTEMYESGHAIYLDSASLPKFKADIAKFIRREV